MVVTIPEAGQQTFSQCSPPLSPVLSTSVDANPDSRRASSWVDYEVPDTRPSSSMPSLLPDPDDDEASVVRQASLSRRQKPKLTHVRSTSGSQLRQPAGELMRNSAADSETLGRRASDFALPIAIAAPLPQSTENGSSANLVNSRVSMANTTRSSNYSDTNLRPPPLTTTTKAEDSPRPWETIKSTASEDSTVNKILDGLERSTSIQTQSTRPLIRDSESKPVRLGGTLTPSALRRPPRISEIPGIGKAKTSKHSSDTSLPELIRRATNLASNLDRGTSPMPGKRSPSRLMIGVSAKEENPFDDYHSCEPSTPGSATDISAILAAFPPPESVAPERQRGSFPGRRSRLGFRTDGTDSVIDEKQAGRKEYKGRRCCGLRLWIVLLFFAFLAVLIVIAIVVPVVLAKQKQSQPGSDCDSRVQCTNGGFSKTVKGSCTCVCVDGYAGSTCQLQPDSGCTTASLPGFDTNGNTTIGTAIPALLAQGSSEFSIPLDSAAVWKAFSTGNTGCSTQNALVTFNGNNQGAPSRRAAKLAKRAPSPVPVPDVASSPVITYVQTGGNSPVTSHGLVYEGYTSSTTASSSSTTSTGSADGGAHAAGISSPTDSAGAAATQTASPTASASPSSSTFPSLNPSSSGNSTTSVLPVLNMQFARCAVLFVLQQLSLDSAITSQNKLQTLMNNGVTAGYSDAGSGVRIDLLGFRIDMGSAIAGGVVGARPSAA